MENMTTSASSECSRVTSTTLDVQLEQVCSMNNVTVDLLEAGLFDSALIVLANATRAAKGLICQCSNVHEIYFDEIGPSVYSFFQTSIVNGRRAGNSNTYRASSEDGAFVYHRVFKLCCTPPLETNCVILLYNTGIGLHLHKIVSCSQHGSKQAAVYYGLALSACIHGTSNLIIPPVLCLVILNNLGEIHFRLCQYDDMANVYKCMKSLKCFDQIGFLIEGPFLDQTEKEGLLWNARFLKRPGTAAAA